VTLVVLEVGDSHGMINLSICYDLYRMVAHLNFSSILVDVPVVSACSCLNLTEKLARVDDSRRVGTKSTFAYDLQHYGFH
jgi:hypothetical protein